MLPGRSSLVERETLRKEKVSVQSSVLLEMAEGSQTQSLMGATLPVESIPLPVESMPLPIKVFDLSTPSPMRFVPYMKLALQYIGSHGTFLANMVLLVLTYGGEEFLEKFVFICPCKHEDAVSFSLLYVFAPAGILLLLGILVRNSTWLLCEGRCNQAKATRPSCGDACPALCVIFFKSCFLPVAWICLCFVDGDYYACMNSETPCDPKSDDYKYYKAYSRYIFWWVSFALVGAAFLVICIAKCFKKRTYLHNLYWETLSDVEKQEMKDYMTKSMQETLASDAKLFLVADILDKADWDRLSLIDPSAMAKPLGELFKNFPLKKQKKIKDELEKRGVPMDVDDAGQNNEKEVHVPVNADDAGQNNEKEVHVPVNASEPVKKKERQVHASVNAGDTGV